MVINTQLSINCIFCIFTSRSLQKNQHNEQSENFLAAAPDVLSRQLEKASILNHCHFSNSLSSQPSTPEIVHGNKQPNCDSSPALINTFEPHFP